MDKLVKIISSIKMSNIFLSYLVCKVLTCTTHEFIKKKKKNEKKWEEKIGSDNFADLGR